MKIHFRQFTFDEAHQNQKRQLSSDKISEWIIFQTNKKKPADLNSIRKIGNSFVS